MLKKFIAFLCIFALLISCFCLPVSALGAEDLIEWYLTWFIDESKKLQNYDGDRLIEYFSTPEGYNYLLALFTQWGGAEGNILFNPATDIVRNVTDANGHKFLSAKVKKDLLQNCVNSYNGFMSSDQSGIRTLNVNNYTIGSNYNLRTDFGYVDGSPPFVGNGTTSSAISTWFHPTAFYSSTVQLYKGSDLCPPILYVPTSGAVTFHSTSLSAGYYMCISDTELFCLGNDERTYKSGWRYDVNSNTGKVTLYYLRHYYNYGNFKFVDCGAYSGSSAYRTVDSGKYTYEYLLDKVTKAPGLYLNLKNQTAYTELPDSDVFDDDDYTVVLLPVDEPAEPIYIHPDTYNDYITNNVYNYDYDNEYVNTVVNDNDVTNIYNIYNTTDSDSSGGSSGGYDDHNLLVTLRQWFSLISNKLDSIIEIISSGSYSDSDIDYIHTNDIPFKWLDPDPIYDNFSDCIFNNIPLFGTVRDTLDSLNNINYESEEMQSVKSEMFSSLGVSVSSSSSYADVSSDDSSDVTFNMPVFEVIFDYIEPHKDDVRNLLQLLAYSLGFVSFYKSTCSLFGIHISVSDLKG